MQDQVFSNWETRQAFELAQKKKTSQEILKELFTHRINVYQAMSRLEKLLGLDMEKIVEEAQFTMSYYNYDPPNYWEVFVRLLDGGVDWIQLTKNEVRSLPSGT
jgi:hypothetical protein